MTIRIITADVIDGLAQLSDESVNCVVTSPPYWGLRDYGVVGQIGLEPTPDAFVARLVEVFREVRRVLCKDGVLFLNLGDSYCNTDKWGGGGGNTGKQTVVNGEVPSWAVRRKRDSIPGVKHKDLVGIPWMTAFALRADGWWLRQEIIWHKPNPMPESVTDRCTKAHEHIFLLTRGERYHYDAKAIREDAAKGYDGSEFNKGKTAGHQAGRSSDKPRAGAQRIKVPGGWDRGEGAHGTIHREVRTQAEYQEAVVQAGRNKRSVWTIATQAFAEAHFATFPEELAATCIKAGCPAGGVVLDPFGGAGTTGLVADRLGRDAVLIELNPDYAAMAERRIARGRLERGAGTMETVRAAGLPETPLESWIKGGAPA